jgi:hypothetical protein
MLLPKCSYIWLNRLLSYVISYQGILRKIHFTIYPCDIRSILLRTDNEVESGLLSLIAALINKAFLGNRVLWSLFV